MQRLIADVPLESNFRLGVYYSKSASPRTPSFSNSFALEAVMEMGDFFTNGLIPCYALMNTVAM